MTPTFFQCAPFHVMNIFDDADDMAWYTSALLSDVVDSHAPIKSKFVKRQSVPYMNSKLRKALYSRNMARNKFRTFGKKYWEENRRLRNHVVSLRKKSIAKYFENNCAKQDKTGVLYRLSFRIKSSEMEIISYCVNVKALLLTAVK